jgi:hypothetical protein
MRKNISLAAIFVLASAAPALAGGKEGTVGVGAEVGLNGLTGGASVNYDAGPFHVGGFLGFQDGNMDDDTDYTLGARFYYHVHDTTMSDFSVGVMVGFFSRDDQNVMVDNRNSEVYFEPGAQIRAFISNNVALSFTAGISFGLADANGAGLGAQLQGVAGVHYYFFK